MISMKTKVLIAILSLTAMTQSYTSPISAANMQNPIRISTRPALVGLWGMLIPENKKCTEYYNFKSNNDVFIRSGEEWSYGVYDYQPTLDPTTLPAFLSLNIRYDNNKKDCSGIQEDQSGELTRVAITWHTPKHISFCLEDQPNQCFASLKRINP
jgi:hypothetical protein